MADTTRVEAPIFGRKHREKPRATEEGLVYQTLKPGRLVRIGVLSLKSETDTQLDLPSPRRTIVSTHKEDKGEIRNDDRFGNVMWRFARVTRSSDIRLEGKGVWIGWTTGEDGKFTQPLLHPDSRRANPTLGFEKL